MTLNFQIRSNLGQHLHFLRLFLSIWSVFTFGADLADLLYVVPCAVVDRVRDSSLADDLMLTG